MRSSTFVLPRLFQIALLHRRKLRIDDDDFRLERVQPRRAISSTLPVPMSVAGRGLRQRHDPFGDHIEADGGGQPHGFRKTRFRIAPEILVGAAAGFGFDMNDKRRAPSRELLPLLAALQAVSSAAGSTS